MSLVQDELVVMKARREKVTTVGAEMDSATSRCFEQAGRAGNLYVLDPDNPGALVRSLASRRWERERPRRARRLQDEPRERTSRSLRIGEGKSRLRLYTANRKTRQQHTSGAHRSSCFWRLQQNR